MGQRVVHRVDAAVVTLEIHHAMRLSDAPLALGAEFALQRFDERCEHIQHQRATFRQHRVEFRIDAGIDHDGARPMLLTGAPDLQRRLAGLGHRIHERDPIGDEAGFRKLRQQAVANGLGGNAGAVGDVEHGTQHDHWLPLRQFSEMPAHGPSC